MNDAGLVLIGSLLALLGVAAVIYQLLLAWRAARASGWPTVSGRVISSRVEEGPPSKEGVFWMATRGAVLAYAYEVGGKGWIAHRVFFGDQLFKSDNSALDLITKYRPNTLVRVSYDPDDPSNAVLETGVRVEHGLGIAGGLFCCAVGVALAAGIFR